MDGQSIVVFIGIALAYRLACWIHDRVSGDQS